MLASRDGAPRPSASVIVYRVVDLVGRRVPRCPPRNIPVLPANRRSGRQLAPSATVQWAAATEVEGKTAPAVIRGF